MSLSILMPKDRENVNLCCSFKYQKPTFGYLGLSWILYKLCLKPYIIRLELYL